ncbi:TetR/AcrR family transcriptional regulator [Actinotalea fermentans]|uniref:TetR family transcriptional regulator n=1 Tax=Actinotalea fermentans TaxID=43671 RepID=A0A511YZ43_9CELL|nr:TetR family transcriptional regulator [Actinotalea fermentans]GEN80469.1 TetR family transcriptional regulator [Actinotalea fermentans]
MSPRRAKVLSEESSPGALRRHLVAVTQRLVAAHGVGLTARQIAHEAQVADGALYNHFANKNDLVVTALVESAAAASEEYVAALPEPGAATLAGNLRTLAAASVRLQLALTPLFTGLLGDAPLLHEFFARVHGERGPQQTFSATVAYLRAEQDLGRASREADAGAVAGLLFGGSLLHALVGHLGAVSQAPVGPGAEPDLDATVAVLLRALRP